MLYQPKSTYLPTAVQFESGSSSQQQPVIITESSIWEKNCLMLNKNVQAKFLHLLPLKLNQKSYCTCSMWFYHTRSMELPCEHPPGLLMHRQGILGRWEGVSGRGVMIRIYDSICIFFHGTIQVQYLALIARWDSIQRLVINSSWPKIYCGSEVNKIDCLKIIKSATCGPTASVLKI